MDRAKVEDVLVGGGSEGLPGVRLSIGDASAVIALFGAHVVSYRSGKERGEVLFMSDLAVKDGSKPIRGGIPLVFPQFGSGKLMDTSHGFARRSTWRRIPAAEIGSPLIEREVAHVVSCFELLPSDIDEKFRDVWPKCFRLRYLVTLTEGSLTTELFVRNEDAKTDFEFQALLHTYLNVDNIANVCVRGAEASSYVDQLRGGEMMPPAASPITFQSETDRIYVHPDSELSVEESAANQRILVKTWLHQRAPKDASWKKNVCNCVVWNPWIAKSKRMSDFGNEEYKRMLCVEPGCVAKWHVCKAGDECVLGQEIRPLPPIVNNML